MDIYKVYYKGVYKCAFYTKKAAEQWILSEKLNGAERDGFRIENMTIED